MLTEPDPAKCPAIVIFDAPRVTGFDPPLFHISRSAGFIHFVRANDYLGACQYLITPTEVLDYLSFRERKLKQLPPGKASISEQALVGQFMGGDLDDHPHKKYEGVFNALIDDREEWDISFITENFGDHVTYSVGDSSPTKHYRILTELAKLTRVELKAFKERFRLALEAVREDRFTLPYRFAVPRTNCGFLILAVPSDISSKARIALTNSSAASKYDFAVTRHVSLSIVRKTPYLDIEWMFIEGDNAKNAEIEEYLATAPFRPTKEKEEPRYRFDSDILGRELREMDGG
jgi:hypothetical protein